MADYDAFLLVSFGGPEGPDDVMPFLQNVTRGRGIPRERLEAVARHYDAVGGVSPISQQCRDLITAIGKDFAAAGVDLPIYWGNRNWDPYLTETVAEMRTAGVRRALAFVTSAYGSYSSCRQYLDDIERARAEAGPDAPQIDKIRHFFSHPGFIEPFADATRRAIASLPPGARQGVPLVFTAHSVPQAMAEASGPPPGGRYPAQLAEAARLIAERVNGVAGPAGGAQGGVAPAGEASAGGAGGRPAAEARAGAGPAAEARAGAGPAAEARAGAGPAAEARAGAGPAAEARAGAGPAAEARAGAGPAAEARAGAGPAAEARAGAGPAAEAPAGAGPAELAPGGGHPWRLVYQSRSGPPSQPWLGPDVCDYLEELARGGAPGAVLVPVGFTSDHMEVVHDLDVEAAGVARRLRLPLARAATPGTDPRFVSMITALVSERLGSPLPRAALGSPGCGSADCCRPPAPGGRPGRPAAS